MDAGSVRHRSAWTRPLRRLVRPFLTRDEQGRIASAIAAAEQRTTGTITVLVVARARGDVMARARREFARLGLDRTPDRTGVLILVAHLDHAFAIWGDAGIVAVTDATRWNAATEALLTRFQERRYADGVIACIDDVGAVLARHFPRL